MGVCTHSQCTGDFSGVAMKVDSSEIKKIILNYPNNSFVLDPLPAWRMKNGINSLFHPIAAIINSSR